MGSNTLGNELAEFRREVKSVLDTALSETDAPLVVADLKQGPVYSVPLPTYTKQSRSWHVCTAEGIGIRGRQGNDDMGAVDRELALLEQSNAALFAALAQTRAMPVSVLPPALGARMRSIGAHEDARAAARRREATEIQERERRRRLKNRKLAEETNDLRQTVSELEKQKEELVGRLEEKRQRRERRARRQAEARQQEENRRRDEEARKLRRQVGSTAREAGRLRAKLRNGAEQAARTRAKEALWRWRASAAASVAARERRERLQAEQAIATSTRQSFARRGSRERDHTLTRKSSEVDRYESETGCQNGDVFVPGVGYQNNDGGGDWERTICATVERRGSMNSVAVNGDAVSATNYSLGDTRRRASTTLAVEAVGQDRGQERVRRSLGEATLETARLKPAARAGRQHVDRVATANDVAAVTESGTSLESRKAQKQLARLTVEKNELERRLANVEVSVFTAAAAKQAAARPRRGSPTEEVLGGRQDKLNDARAWRTRRGERTKTLVQTLAIILRAGVRAGEKQQVQAAFGVLREAARAMRAASEHRAAKEARGAHEAKSSVLAGVKVATVFLARARRRKMKEALRRWRRVSEDTNRKQLSRKAAFRRVVYRTAQRAREIKVKAFQRWRLAAAAAAMTNPRQQQLKKDLRRGAVMAEAILKRQDGAVQLAGFQRWKNADAKLLQGIITAAPIRDRRATAASTATVLLHRYRRSRLRKGFYALGASAKATAERRRRGKNENLLATKGQWAARALLVTRCWGTWKAFAAAAGSARRLKAAGKQASRIEAEKRHGAEQLAWVCKAATAVADTRRKACAWRLWRQSQGITKHEHALAEPIMLTTSQCRRVSRLGLGFRKWQNCCKAARVERELTRRRAASLQVASLQKRQGVRVLFRMLRSSRRDLIARTMYVWRSACVRRIQDGRRLHGLALRVAHRQRLFFLGKAWSRLVWVTGERVAAKARQHGAARTIHSILASASRASRRKAWIRWKQNDARGLAAERLNGVRRLALHRCLRTQLSREMRVVWEVLRSRVQQSRALISGATCLEEVLARTQQRTCSRRLGMWRSESLAEAIATAERQTTRSRQHEAMRFFVATLVRVRRGQVEGAWRALILFTANSRQEEAERAARSVRTDLLVQSATQRTKTLEMVKVWKAWASLVEQRRRRNAVNAATSSLEEQRTSLAKKILLLKLDRAVRVAGSIMERSNRALLQRGWQALRQATRRRTIFLRALGVSSRSHSQRLRLALHRWRLVATEGRAADVRVEAGRSILVACLTGVRRRAMQPAWETWSELVIRERGEEDEFAGHEEGLLSFAVLLMRMGKRADKVRERRALGVWRLRLAQSAAREAQRQVAQGSEVAKAAEVEKVGLLAAQIDCQQTGARLALRWLHRQQVAQKISAWRQWAVITAEKRTVEERREWRVWAVVQLARELASVVERRRRKILRRSLHLWRHQAEQQLADDVTTRQQNSTRETGARRLGVVLECNLIRRKARVWARLISSTVAASGRLKQEREKAAYRDNLVAAAELRLSRRLLSTAWFEWKSAWAKGRHQSEVKKFKAAQGAWMVISVTRRIEEDTQRQALSLWGSKTYLVRKREHAVSKIASFLLRSRTRAQRDRMARCLARWRLACAEGGRALAEKDRASAEAAFRGWAILSILRRKRLHRLGGSFRRLLLNQTLSLYGTKEEQARRDNMLRGLHSLKRVVERKLQRRVVRAFGRWQCFAAEVRQQSDRALLVSAQRRASAQILGSIFSRHEVFVLSRAWTLWRSGAASAAIHNGERASADLRVTGARHSVGVRVLATVMSGTRRKSLWKAWNVWRTDVKEASNAELQSMEKHFHLARTLTRVKQRNQLARVDRAWRTWGRHLRFTSCLLRVAGRTRRAQLAQGMTQWRLVYVHQGQAKAEEGMIVAQETLRARALSVLIKCRAQRQLRESFHRLFEHGAWAIFFSKKEKIREFRLSQGFRAIARVCARRKERTKLAAFGRWRYLVSESRRQEDRALLQATGKKAGVKTLALIAASRERALISRAWTIWRSGTTAAAMHEDERASADSRVFSARRSAGVRLLVGVMGLARRRALAKAWLAWSMEAKAAADAELQTQEKYFYLARTLTRVERRTQLVKMARAWRAWREVVQVEGEAEVQALERNFHVAQTVARVANRAQERRLLRAWGLWARQAARGRPRVLGSLPSFPTSLLAAARTSLAPSLTRAKIDVAPSIGAAAPFSAAKQFEERARCSRSVRHKAGAVSVRGLLRRAAERSLLHSWKSWRGATLADATRKAQVILGTTRMEELLTEIEENHNSQTLYQSWGKWVEWSTAESERLKQVEESAAWAVAEAEENNMKVSAAARALAAVTGRWEIRMLRGYFGAWVGATGIFEDSRFVDDLIQRLAQETSETTAVSPARIVSEDHKTRHGRTREGTGLDGKTYYSSSPSSALSALRRKIRGEPSPTLPVQPPNFVEAGPSPCEANISPNRFTEGTPQVRQWLEGRLKILPPSPLPQGSGEGKEGAEATPVDGQAWWGESSDTSSAELSSGPASCSVSYASYLVGGVGPEGEIASTVRYEDDHGSMNLSVSPKITLPLLLHSAPGTAQQQPLTAAMRSQTLGSTPGSSMYDMSDSSPLVGERVLRLANVGRGNGEAEVLAHRRLEHERALAEENDGVTVVQSPTRNRYASNEGEPEEDRAGRSSSVRTPEDPLLRWSDSSDGSGWRRNRSRSAHFSKSPPHWGSVHALSSSRDWQQWTEEKEDNEVRYQQGGSGQAYESYGGPLDEDVIRSGLKLRVRREMGSAEAFVSRLTLVLWRRAFNHWVRVGREAVYNRTMTDTKRKVALLWRQQKLRKIVISALRRQSYAWHVNDTSRAIRKWRELVRSGREDDRLSFELSRISAISPMTPADTRTFASGLENYRISSGSGGGAAAGYRCFDVSGNGWEENGTPSFSRSSLSPITTGSSSMRRRLWDQA